MLPKNTGAYKTTLTAVEQNQVFQSDQHNMKTAGSTP
jgi:hypothetical protein